MRFVFALFIVLGLMATSAVSVPGVIGEGSSIVAAQQPPTGQLEVDIDTGGGGEWWMSPLWIGIGVVALIAVIALIVAAARGGGTTVVKG
jgi:hypothetical protein